MRFAINSIIEPPPANHRDLRGANDIQEENRIRDALQMQWHGHTPDSRKCFEIELGEILSVHCGGYGKSERKQPGRGRHGHDDGGDENECRLMHRDHHSFRDRRQRAAGRGSIAAGC